MTIKLLSLVVAQMRMVVILLVANLFIKNTFDLMCLSVFYMAGLLDHIGVVVSALSAIFERRNLPLRRQWLQNNVVFSYSCVFLLLEHTLSYELKIILFNYC